MARKYNADGVEYFINENMTAQGIERYATVKSFRSDLDTVHIRSQVLDIPVIEIEDNAAANHEYLKEIYIPPSVTDIGKQAFYNCCELQYVHFEGSGEEVILKEQAFFDCEKLITVFGNRLLYLLGEQIFLGCKKLLSIPNLSGGISNDSFAGCKKLRGVYLTDEIRFTYVSEFGLNNSSINTITVFGQAAFAENALKHLAKKGVAIKASELSCLEDLAYSGILVQRIGK